MGVRTGVFGGTFDPPHRGHKAMARFALERVGLDRMLVAPLNDPWHKAGPRVPWEHRAAMVDLLVADDPRLALTDIDRVLGGTTYTYRTLEALAEGSCRGDELFFLMGADSMEYFHEWRNWRRILELARPVVVARPGHRLAVSSELTANERARFIVLRGFRSRCSSTAVRQRLAAGLRCPGLTAPVMRYIRDNGLYGTAGKGRGDHGR